MSRSLKVWPLALFVACFLMGIVAVPAGIGGGTLFVPIVGSFFPFHLDFVRGAGLLVALASALAAGPSLMRGGLGSLRLALPLSALAAASSIGGAMLGLSMPVNEVQMLLYTHPLNAEREARGLLPVNSFWLSGCGALQRSTAEPPRVDERLRGPALSDDWAAWAKAWQTLDEGPLAELLQRAEQGQPVRLTLCGERSGAAFESAPRGWAQRLRSLWSAPRVQDILEPL